jgi:hypothetical protein
MRQQIVYGINGELSANAKPNLVPIDNVNDSVSYKAYIHAISPTVPKTEIASKFFKNLHWYYQFAIVFTAIAFLVTTWVYYAKFIDPSAYVGAVVVIVIAFVFELGASIVEQWSNRDVEELE